MKKLLVVCGATATGKTALAVECAKRLNGEVVSADALLVYRGLTIGTAKPTKEEMGGVPHHMIDVAEPTERFSVSDYERLARPIVEDILARGKLPVLCGGTGFYLNALLYERTLGGAPADAALRARLEAVAEEKGKAYLHEMLREVDPESAETLHENDVRRVIRALEIYALTGKRKSEQHDAPTPRYDFSAVAFAFPRGQLYARIDARVDAMMRAGLVEEVKGLLARGVAEDAQCMQGIGYKEVVEGQKNGYMQSTMSDIIKKNTRNYAKRQLTFFKKFANLRLLAPQSAEKAADEVIEEYEQH